MKNIVEKDIWEWIKNYIEVNHEFYDYKFSPCPYAKSARLKNTVAVSAYDNDGYSSFIINEIKLLLKNNNLTTKILAFPNYFKFNICLKFLINNINKKLVKRDYYIQYGNAVGTDSVYDGGPYFIIIINKLSDVLSAQNSLAKTDYYSFWSSKHYDTVVNRRKNFFEKYKK